MEKEERAQPRAELDAVVRLKSPSVDEFLERHSRDISEGGLFVRSESLMPVSSLVKVEIQLDDDTMIKAVGRVVWSRAASDAEEPDRPAGMGIKFVRVEGDGQERIAEIVAKRGASEGTFERSTGATEVEESEPETAEASEGGSGASEEEASEEEASEEAARAEAEATASEEEAAGEASEEAASEEEASEEAASEGASEAASTEEASETPAEPEAVAAAAEPGEPRSAKLKKKSKKARRLEAKAKKEKKRKERVQPVGAKRASEEGVKKKPSEAGAGPRKGESVTPAEEELPLLGAGFWPLVVLLLVVTAFAIWELSR